MSANYLAGFQNETGASYVKCNLLHKSHGGTHNIIHNFWTSHIQTHTLFTSLWIQSGQYIIGKVIPVGSEILFSTLITVEYKQLDVWPMWRDTLSNLASKLFHVYIFSFADKLPSQPWWWSCRTLWRWTKKHSSRFLPPKGRCSYSNGCASSTRCWWPLRRWISHQRFDSKSIIPWTVVMWWFGVSGRSRSWRVIYSVFSWKISSASCWPYKQTSDRIKLALSNLFFLCRLGFFLPRVGSI